ncbi:negative elongation factor B-like [Sycon ciliatum]|uniref:negative elongation factor B-like n=1 Tax=Sycon ciliatum TaxID=27933 RepID=UPI0020AB3B3B|eukprot:scpid44112/ scgid34629/ Negative elongation factor B; Cofactor of BRCA1
MDGAESIRSMLTDCDNPVAAIKSFQETHRFSTPVVESAIPLLDLLGRPRHEFHMSVLTKFTETLSAKVKEFNAEQKGKLLSEIIFLAHIQPVQQLLKELLSVLKPVPGNLLELLASNPKAYACCPIHTKREIWEQRSDLFCEEVNTILERYMDEKETAVLSADAGAQDAAHFFEIAPRTRRQHSCLTQLVDMVASSQNLYSVLCSLLRTLFGQSGIAHYCTVRMDVLMALHETQHMLVRQDPCHKLTWCLDACVREHKIDEKRIKEISTLISQQDVDGDMAMATHQPHVLHLLCTSLVSLLGDMAKQCKLPRESSNLKVLLRLINRSLMALKMFQSESFTEPPLEFDVIHRHMAVLVNVCSDMDGIAIYTTLMAETGTADESFHSALVQPLPASFTKVLTKHPTVLVLTLHLAARTAKRGCSKSLQRLLHCIVAALEEDGVSRHVPSTVWFHFFYELTRLSEVLLAEEVSEELGSLSLAAHVFVNLIIPLCRSNPDCLGYALRLLAFWPLSAKTAVSDQFQDSWLEALQPSATHSACVWKLYRKAFDSAGWPTFYPESD